MPEHNSVSSLVLLPTSLTEGSQRSGSQPANHDSFESSHDWLDDERAKCRDGESKDCSIEL
eukprot:766847-Hanusia_phi.AAC.4